MAPASNLALANRLLAALPAADRMAVLADCELVDLKASSGVIEAGEVLSHAWFPVEGFVSLTLPLDEGPALEVGLIGDEGMFDSSVVLGAHQGAFAGWVRATGRAFRLEHQTLHTLLAERTCLRKVLLGYADMRYRQLARQAACLTHHSVGQRLARWLLMARDRSHASELFLTHETLALMLGARRESVTQAARRMQLLGQISYSRGYVMLLDLPSLERQACSCYRHDRDAYHAWWSELADAEVASLAMRPGVTAASRDHSAP